MWMHVHVYGFDCNTLMVYIHVGILDHVLYDLCLYIDVFYIFNK